MTTISTYIHIRCCGVWLLMTLTLDSGHSILSTENPIRFTTTLHKAISENHHVTFIVLYNTFDCCSCTLRLLLTRAYNFSTIVVKLPCRLSTFTHACPFLMPSTLMHCAYRTWSFHSVPLFWFQVYHVEGFGGRNHHWCSDAIFSHMVETIWAERMYRV